MSAGCRGCWLFAACSLQAPSRGGCSYPAHHRQPLCPTSLRCSFRVRQGRETGALGFSPCSHCGLGALLGPSSQPARLHASLADVQGPGPSWKGFCRGLSCSQHADARITDASCAGLSFQHYSLPKEGWSTLASMFAGALNSAHLSAKHLCAYFN